MAKVGSFFINQFNLGLESKNSIIGRQGELLILKINFKYLNICNNMDSLQMQIGPSFISKQKDSLYHIKKSVSQSLNMIKCLRFWKKRSYNKNE